MGNVVAVGWQAHLEVDDLSITLVRQNPQPGLPATVRIPLAEVSRVAFEPATATTAGRLDIHTSAAVHPIGFVAFQQAAFETAAGWLQQVADINTLARPAEPEHKPDLAPFEYAVFDLETTGLFPARNDRIVEVAIVHVDAAGNIGDEWSTLINPQRDVGPTHIHGISAADVRNAPTLVDIADELADRMAGRIAVAHNISFDARFLLAEYERINAPAPINRHSGLCTMQLAAHFVPSANRKLLTCCEAMGITLENAHSALGDTRATAQLFGRMLSEHGSDPRMRNHGSPVPQRTKDGLGPLVKTVQRGEAKRLPGTWLSRLAADVPPGEFDEYVDLLDRCMLDKSLSAREEESLIELAASLGIHKDQAIELHRQYLHDLAVIAWQDGVITDQERDALHQAARHLGVDASFVDDVLTRPLEGTGQSARSMELAVGDRVSFTGDLKFGRNNWQDRASAAGLKVDGVTKLTRVLVAADADTMSGKGQRAEKSGIPIIGEAAFEALIVAFESRPGLA